MLILFFPFVLKGDVFFDVDEIDSDSGKGIRIAVFNVDAQKFLHLAYVKSAIPIIKTEGESLHEQERIPLNLPFLPEGLALFSNGDLKVESCPPCIVRTFGNLQSAEHILPHVTEMGGKKILLPTFKAKSGPEIYEHLSSFTDDSTTPHFEVSIFSEGLPSQETKTFKDLGETERGVLGELATEMTMITYRYQKLPSQNKKGQGFDGVYIGVEDGEESVNPKKFLFLTESKCRQESVSAENYLIKTLNESALCTQINKGDLSQDTKKAIECFIAHAPDNIYKFVHRLKINGQFQCAVASFNIHAYRLAQLTSDSFSSIPRSDQVSLFSYLYQEKLRLSPITALQYVLEAYNLSPGEGSSLLTLHALQDDRRAHIFSHFPDVSTSPLAEQSSILSSPLTGVSAGSVTTKASRSEAPSTSDLTNLLGQLSLNTPSSSPVPKKNQHVRRLFLPSPSTPSPNRAFSPEASSIAYSPFGEYEPAKLTYFVTMLKKGIEGSKGIGRPAMKKFYDSSKKSSNYPQTLSDTPFKNLLKGGTSREGKAIWETFTQNFTELCKKAKVSEQKFLDKWREKYPDIRECFLNCVIFARSVRSTLEKGLPNADRKRRPLL